jgi:hypothetical protein
VCFVQLLFLLVGFGYGVDGVADDAAPDQKVVFRVIHIHRQLARVVCGNLALGFAVVTSVPAILVPTRTISPIGCHCLAVKVSEPWLRRRCQ